MGAHPITHVFYFAFIKMDRKLDSLYIHHMVPFAVIASHCMLINPLQLNLIHPVVNIIFHSELIFLLVHSQSVGNLSASWLGSWFVTNVMLAILCSHSSFHNTVFFLLLACTSHKHLVHTATNFVGVWQQQKQIQFNLNFSSH